ncbi:MAG TPA: nuclear transport factor 2 family protein [Rheinheimera sp.]|nr:nuclear transport factor 2 family protein [Rheinheimera sp.]
MTIATPRIEQFLRFYNGLSTANMQQLEQLYHVDVEFIDPVHRLQGREALSHYFSHAYARLQHCEFSALEKIEQGDQGFLSWRMQLRHPAIRKGEIVCLNGCSVLRWRDGLIVYHRDYYDLTEMVYQHLPVIAWLTAKVKQRMAGPQ